MYTASVSEFNEIELLRVCCFFWSSLKRQCV